MRLFINIPDELEEDFIVLSEMKKMTMEEMITYLIKNYIRRNKKLLTSKEARMILEGTYGDDE
ncbi:MAG: hypothetical protein D6675_09535 [Gemmatimonadetes bacterium]|nr:MAG: hypothetical protein D6675_09535 [Gemmatimonadota bacterium]